MSLLICESFGAAPEAIRSTYHCHEASQFSGIWAVVPSSATKLPEPKNEPTARASSLNWWWKPHCTTFSGSKSGLVASLPLASTVRILASSATLSMSHGSPSAYGSPYAVGGYSRSASSKSSLL